MKHILALLFLLSPFYTLAQESIGFTDSTDFKYLIDYRLPDWGYNSFSIASGGVGFNGDYRNRNSDTESDDPLDFTFSDFESTSFQTGLNIMPQYVTYRENETHIYSLVGSFLVSSTFNNSDDESVNNNSGAITSVDNEISNRRSRLRPSLNFDSKRYLSNDIFLLTKMEADIKYDFDTDNSASNNNPKITTSEIRRDIQLKPSLGLGFGRIRNVTPVIRALRVNERYKTLEGNSLSTQDLEFTSAQFTRIDGYQSSYDRYLKYFWDDLNQGINNKISNLSPYDILFLNDVFNENLGSRLEGYTVSIQALYSYYNQLSNVKQTNENDQRNFQITRSSEIQAKGVWYKNLNLSHQISAELNNQIYLPIEKENSFEWILNSNLRGTWLWILADRIQMENQVSTLFSTHKYKDLGNYENREIHSSLSTSFNYFIENRTSLSAGFSIYHSHLYQGGETPNSDLYRTFNTNRFNWSLNASIRYYFNRNLF